MAVSDGKAIHFLENRTQVQARDYDASHVHMTVLIGAHQLEQLRAMGTSARLPDAAEARPGW